MDLSHKQWMYGGAVLLAAVSGAIVLGRVPNAWVPMPLPIVIVAFVTLILFPFVTPALYLLVLKLSSSSVHFTKIILALVVAIGVLNFMYFQIAWEYGIKYQGPEHTKIVAIENLLGFGVAFVISATALAKGSRALAYTANLTLFVLLSWCAFPYLGELP
ncbi:hypothetical protein [Shewanella psychrotolerans]|uniref:hypothetical protein n=1 Tax=Shewanella psychrotolerans TaxID=2864206 RepID=UPI001C6574DF|nr:hypothetical protein [Shewanella psychrotolerans]QYK02025.1 hypothetical protein K0I62_03350 [Shewanella psychrotolerans]